MHIPLSTYRVQLNEHFTFADLKAILPLLKSLGITDIYASPITQAQAHSSHGYDVIDHNQINRELGGLSGFKRLHKALRKHHLGLIIDFVPNHMAATNSNYYWHHVCELSHHSPYADLFDIKWQKKHTKISYRRFFDINELVCLNQEEKAVFNQTHQLMLDLIKKGQINGLRIDHVDGLKFPKKYLDELQHAIGNNFYVVVEKILAYEEKLPAIWKVAGTTGYDFLNAMNQLFVYTPGLKQLIKHYGKMTLLPKPARLLREKIKKVIDLLFPQEFNALSANLFKIADKKHLNLTKPQLKKGLYWCCINLGIYRTYLDGTGINSHDKYYLDKIPHSKHAKLNDAINFIKNLLLQARKNKIDSLEQEWILNWQVLTGPLLAKGFEDTFCYNFNPLISLNEVGSDLSYYEKNGDKTYFHQFNQYQLKYWPYSLTASSTHDTKRSEDVRARLNVLSERPEVWLDAFNNWHQWNQKYLIPRLGKQIPDKNEEMMLYETVLGCLPLSQKINQKFLKRVKICMTKCLREAKEHSSWQAPHEAYEKHFHDFIDHVFSEENEQFLHSFKTLHRQIAYFGYLNSLAQVCLKLTAPGIPDIYQGNEFFQFDMVDPDNRHPINYTNLAASLSLLRKNINPQFFLNSWKNGQIKLLLTQTLLKLRQKNSQLFLCGEYLPLTVRGPQADHIVAFARNNQGQWLITVVVRWWSLLIKDLNFHQVKWHNTYLLLPPQAPGQWFSIFNNNEVLLKQHKINLTSLLTLLPCNVITNKINL